MGGAQFHSHELVNQVGPYQQFCELCIFLHFFHCKHLVVLTAVLSKFTSCACSAFIGKVSQPFIDHVTPTLCDTQHWLSLSQCLTLKIVLMTYDSICGPFLPYFRDVCVPVVSIVFHSRLMSAGHEDTWTVCYDSMQFLCFITTDLKHTAVSP